MRPEGGARQRGLVDRRIVFSDAERDVSYVFPFVDRRWRVPFVVVALSAGAPLVLDGPYLRRIESIPLEDLGQLVHYDPWWVFRRVTGVARAWIEAVFATNIAAPFRRGGRTHKVRDLIFSAELDRLEEIEARAGLFRAVSFHPGDVELLTLRPASREQSNLRTLRTTKAL